MQEFSHAVRDGSLKVDLQFARGKGRAWEVVLVVQIGERVRIKIKLAGIDISWGIQVKDRTSCEHTDS